MNTNLTNIVRLLVVRKLSAKHIDKLYNPIISAGTTSSQLAESAKVIENTET